MVIKKPFTVKIGCVFGQFLLILSNYMNLCKKITGILSAI